MTTSGHIFTGMRPTILFNTYFIRMDCHYFHLKQLITSENIVIWNYHILCQLEQDCQLSTPSSERWFVARNRCSYNTSSSSRLIIYFWLCRKLHDINTCGIWHLCLQKQLIMFAETASQLLYSRPEPFFHPISPWFF